MQDIVFVTVIVGFFALCVLFVRFCDWLIGPQEQASSDRLVDQELEAA